MKRVLYILGLLDDSDIDWLISSGSRVQVPANHSLIKEGEEIESLFLILEGRFRVLASGKEVATVSSGEIVGEISMLDSRPTTATVTAAVESEVLRIRRSDLQARLETNTAFGCRFYRALAVFLAQRLRASTRQLGYGPADDYDEQMDADELDPDLLDTVDLAGRRFQWILSRIRGDG